jgi:hypothetical protein
MKPSYFVAAAFGALVGVALGLAGPVSSAILCCIGCVLVADMRLAQVREERRRSQNERPQ